MSRRSPQSSRRTRAAIWAGRDAVALTAGGTLNGRADEERRIASEVIVCALLELRRAVMAFEVDADGLCELALVGTAVETDGQEVQHLKARVRLPIRLARSPMSWLASLKLTASTAPVE